MGTGSGCPCGSGGPLAECCGPVVDGTRLASTAEELMRSRYTAYALGNTDHVFRTWHPRTRPETIETDPLDQRWVSLRVIAVEDGGVDDLAGTVEFVATWSGPGGGGDLHEVSRFARRGGRWCYVEGDVS